ncbi:MAG: hypothetical protein II413_09290 [Treponema sp.]|nr:hypothetical protein [Treponema sp.]
MKHSIFLAAAACTLAATFISCASSKGITADAYDTEEEQVTQIAVNPSQKKLDGDHYSPEKLSGSNRSFGQKLFNLNKYEKIDNFTLYAKPTLGGFGTRKGSLIYREGTDIAGFECYYDSCAYAVQFAQAERNDLSAPLNATKKTLTKKSLSARTAKAARHTDLLVATKTLAT